MYCYEMTGITDRSDELYKSDFFVYNLHNMVNDDKGGRLIRMKMMLVANESYPIVDEINFYTENKKLVIVDTIHTMVHQKNRWKQNKTKQQR